MDDVILEVRHLSHRFKLTRKLAVQALDDLSFQVRRGEIFGLVGESGSGKSTVARCVMNLYQPTSGEIWFNGVNITDRSQRRKHKKMLERKRQLIFQDSGSSMNQRMKVVDVITEPMRIQHIQTPRKTPREEAAFPAEIRGAGRVVLRPVSGGAVRRSAAAGEHRPCPEHGAGAVGGG